MSRPSEREKYVLPGGIKPIHYNLRLFNFELLERFSYQGTVDITLIIDTTSTTIVLNSHQLTIHKAHITVNQGERLKEAAAYKIRYDVDKQRIALDFEKELPPCHNAILRISFQGVINDGMTGFYRSKYLPTLAPSSTTLKYHDNFLMLSTHFESSHARMAFPCFDEPNLKATFELSLEIPEDITALSNMPEKNVHVLCKRHGYRTVNFERTPKMSTYLLTWAIGHFEYIEDFSRNLYQGCRIPVRVYTTNGLVEQARFALEHVGLYLDYFSELFGIEFPLPKMDLLAVHEFVRRLQSIDCA